MRDATPEAMTNPPRPASVLEPAVAASVTTNGGLSAETSRKLRVVTKLRNSRSPRRSRRTPTGESVSRPVVGPSSTGSRMPAWTAAVATQNAAPRARSHASWVAERFSPAKIRSARPSVIATMPAAMVPSPLIWPRSPLGTVRPWTSFDAIDVRQRPSENTARAPTIATPAVVPEPTAATSAIAATETA